MASKNHPDQDQASIFQERTVPRDTRLAGWAALVETFHIQVPVRAPTAVSKQHIKGSRRVEGEWTVLDKRYWPGESVADQLDFALRNEYLDLLVLKRLFQAIPQETVTAFVTSAPNGTSNRRAWFLYEFLTGKALDLPDAAGPSFTDLLDASRYFTSTARPSRRHKVRDNLLGTPAFVRSFAERRRSKSSARVLSEAKANKVIGQAGASIVSRAASFLLLADSRASFEIEGEKPPRNRLERWGRAVLQAGKNPLTLDEIVRLQTVLIEDTRFTQPGLRRDGVFLGERDHDGDPLPEFIGARPQDLESLVQGMIAANERMLEGTLDSVLQAAATAFGFFYIHPLQDGNGRLHRCLIHHVLAERKFTALGVVFPVSPVMLYRIEAYRDTLRAHSSPLMNYIEWRPTPERNVEVLNDTADLYRYFDCTEAAEFLYGCVAHAIDEDLPHEIDFLRRNDEAKRRIMNLVEMPDCMTENLVRLIRVSEGKLGRKRREGEFDRFTDDEVISVEAIVRKAFEDFVG